MLLILCHCIHELSAIQCNRKHDQDDVIEMTNTTQDDGREDILHFGFILIKKNHFESDTAKLLQRGHMYMYWDNNQQQQ